MTRVGAGLSRNPATPDAAREAARACLGPLDGRRVDLAFVFLSPHHLDEAEDAADAVRAELAPRHLLGCVAQGIVGGPHEVEEGPAAAVWAASLPGAEIEPFHAEPVETGTGLGVAGFPEPESASLVALLVDPYTFPAAGLLERLNEELAGRPGRRRDRGGRERARLAGALCDDRVYEGGAVGAVLAASPSERSSRRAARRSAGTR